MAPKAAAAPAATRDGGKGKGGGGKARNENRGPKPSPWGISPEEKAAKKAAAQRTAREASKSGS